MATARTNTTGRARPRLGPRAAGVVLSAEEFDAIPSSAWDARFRYELIRGVLVVSPPPGAAARGPNEELGFLLLTYQGTHAEGGALDATLPERTVLGTSNRRRADRVVWAGLGRTPDPGSDLLTVVVEFVSRSRRDLLRDDEEKRDEYRAAGVPEYWIIDRFERIMKIFRNTPTGLEERTVREGEVYTTDRLPGFELPLSRLLLAADRWEPASPRTRRRPRPAGGI